MDTKLIKSCGNKYDISSNPSNQDVVALWSSSLSASLEIGSVLAIIY